MFVKFLRQFSLNILALAIIATPITASMTPFNLSVDDTSSLEGSFANNCMLTKEGKGTVVLPHYLILPMEADLPEDISSVYVKIESGFVRDCNSVTISGDTIVRMQHIPIPDRKRPGNVFTTEESTQAIALRKHEKNKTYAECLEILQNSFSLERAEAILANSSFRHGIDISSQDKYQAETLLRNKKIKHMKNT